MKLLYCPKCHDVHGLVMNEWRMCLCEKSGGQYNEDGMTATIGGAARVFGVGNPFFNDLYPYLDDAGKKKMRQDMYGQPNTDAWWGEYENDQQIFRIAWEEGPRLEVKVEYKGVALNMMRVVVTDKRYYTIAGIPGKTDVVVPRNPQLDDHERQLTRWDSFTKRFKKQVKERLQKIKEKANLMPVTSIDEHIRKFTEEVESMQTGREAGKKVTAEMEVKRDIAEANRDSRKRNKRHKGHRSRRPRRNPSNTGSSVQPRKDRETDSKDGEPGKGVDKTKT